VKKEERKHSKKKREAVLLVLQKNSRTRKSMSEGLTRDEGEDKGTKLLKSKAEGRMIEKKRKKRSKETALYVKISSTGQKGCREGEKRVGLMRGISRKALLKKFEGKKTGDGQSVEAAELRQNGELGWRSHLNKKKKGEAARSPKRAEEKREIPEAKNRASRISEAGSKTGSNSGGKHQRHSTRSSGRRSNCFLEEGKMDLQGEKKLSKL